MKEKKVKLLREGMYFDGRGWEGRLRRGICGRRGDIETEA